MSGSGHDNDGESRGSIDTGGFAVYSTDYEPQRLHSRGDAVAVDTGRVAEVVQFGDRPLDLYVDLESNQLLWSFKADRHTKSTRTGYFVAAYRSDGDLFQGFEAELRQLHDSDDWTVPYVGNPRWDIGFDLWRVPSEVSGLGREAFGRLVDRLGERGGLGPLEFGMKSHRTAVQAVKALESANVDCTVAIGTDGDAAELSTVDLLLRPDADTDFVSQTLAAREVVDADSSRLSSETPSETPVRDRDTGSLANGLAGAVLLVCLGFAGYSFVSPTPVRPITGLATLGGFVGSLLGLVSARTIHIGDQLGVDAESPDRPSLRPSQTPDGPGDTLQAMRELLVSSPTRPMLILAYGTVLAFGFPRIAWEFGLILGQEGFPFGSIASVPGSFPTVALYAFGVYVLSVCLLLVRGIQSGNESISVDTLGSAAIGHLAYASCLFVATGFASSLWYLLVPAAG